MVAVAQSPRSLAEVRDLESGVSYPGDVLRGCETALVLFCARWFGRQDAYWIAEAGLRAVCVDLDGERIAEMKRIYPKNWGFATGDAWAIMAPFARNPHAQRWDVVSLDPFTNLMDLCSETLPLWCSLARKAVILGTGHQTAVHTPEGWQVTDVRKRSDYAGGVYWTVLEPA